MDAAVMAAVDKLARENAEDAEMMEEEHKKAVKEERL